MSAKLVFVVGVLGVGGYFGHKMMAFDPTIFPYSKEQAQTMLVEATTTLPRRDGPGQIRIWSAGRSQKGVTLNMRYADWAPLLECEAVVTEIAPNKVKVVPDCGSGPAGSAIGQTEHQLQTPMFEEHIQSTLNRRAFDRSIATRKETAMVFKNLGGMQHEALQRADETQRMQAEANANR
jgi:hypothetical protein